ncbi:NAD-dependent protein deacylase Sirt4-like isoform X3 [Portunus trituberculatus]|uniref:NAD-dependent protein deacylase Sirt4-like isoform X3 n=1 Tax=Portunus trituberculatus TaxID=210409 RepID=UPI001E1CD303|nr:NAD-dependent protein deacylase Sirt4-like isoform X3 [Portunus trituberculatus]XP_045116909.1 NAD-dependent protein deacylase Sirt4-like isoform X3 [Portunus trituberculatus]XP_045116910.1 NAD-dependent protein deacylase Sirt4-like isoform X3 [Portunus trituberculatus]XP_045116911.1 NAD-dependent protein deacylase Sirt4-like isoform X3 [Portunus trituberculatus]
MQSMMYKKHPAGCLTVCLRVVPRRWTSQYSFVPKHQPCQDRPLSQLQEFLDSSKRLFVLTGAGISTESGIPDYRSEGVGLYATSSRRPIQYKQFMDSSKARQRYWARNYVGWQRFSSVTPNAAHTCLTAWERSGKLACTVTQNVDRLHHKAGTANVVELHGSAFNVVCMNCRRQVVRHYYQTCLTRLNPHLTLRPVEMRPDGDVDLTQEEVDNFRVPPCEACGGIMKPDLVFFGESVPRERVERVKRELAECDALLVLGSSLYVYSGYRFILAGLERGMRMCGVNIGPTRGDPHFQFRINARCGDVLPRLHV